MATLDEIRKVYPAYADMPDAALADAIHAKLYSDMPRDVFNAKIGFKPEAADNRASWERLPDRRGFAKGMEQGVGDVVVGATQLGAHVLPNSIVSPEAAAAVDRAVKAREAGIQATRPDNYGLKQVTNSEGLTSHVAPNLGKGFDMARVVGNAAGTLPAVAMGPVAGTIAGSVVMPTTGDNFWMDKGKQALTGAVVGAGTKVLAGALAPEIRPAAQNLADRGVKLTPGMMSGKYAKAAEDRLTSIPGPGAFVENSQRAAVESFNRAVYDEVLSPVGLKFAGKEVGYAGVNKVDDMLGAAYDKLLPKLQFRPDGQLAADLNANLSPILSTMAEPQRKQFIGIFKTYVENRLLQGGGVGGEVFKKVESEISAKARQFSSSAVASEQDIATALTAVKQALRENLERANPAHAGELQPLNAAYARFVRLQGAAAKRVSSEGVFTPGDLAGAVKQADSSVRKGAFARGDALMQDLSSDAMNVMGNKYPDSGTAGRWLQSQIQGATLGAAAAAPIGAAYNPLSLSLMNLWATPGPARQLAGQATREVGPLLTPGATQEYLRLGN